MCVSGMNKKHSLVPSGQDLKDQLSLMMRMRKPDLEEDEWLTQLNLMLFVEEVVGISEALDFWETKEQQTNK